MITPPRSATSPRTRLTFAVLSVALLAGCGSSESSAPTSAAAAPESTTAVTALNEPATPSAPAETVPAVNATTTTAGDTAGAIVNVWSGPAIDPTQLPIGDDFVSTTTPAVGWTFSCQPGNPNAGGASADGPWLNIAAGTWDSTNKLAVSGSVVWEAASFTETVNGGTRTLVTNNLPVADPTGNFPIASSDPAYQYDRNPGTVTAQSITLILPQPGVVAPAPTCVPIGAIGMTRNGVVLFNALDARGDDAVAHELQDLCDGHPARVTYHYHNIPSCLRNKATGSSTVVGFANDGFPIVVERDASGALPTNDDLDECHGRTSPISLDGAVVETYHYSVTLEFPYVLGCYRGTPVGS